MKQKISFIGAFKKMGQAARKAVSRVAKEIKWRIKVKEAKAEILSRFTVNQLKSIAISRSIELYDEDPLTEERYYFRTKGEIVDAMASNLSFREILNLARRYKVRYRDVLEELEKYREELFKTEEKRGKEKRQYHDIIKRAEEADEDDLKVDRDSDKLVQIIMEFEPLGVVKEEKNLRDQLARWIAGKIGRNAVRLEYPFEHGKADVVVNDEIAIEIKVAENKGILKNLLGEVQTDILYFKKVIAVLFDVGKNIDLDFFKKQLRLLGATVIVIPAHIRRKGRTQEIIIHRSGRKIVLR